MVIGNPPIAYCSRSRCGRVDPAVQLALSRDGQLDVEAFEHMRALGGGDETGN